MFPAQRKKWRPEKIWKKQVEEVSVGVGLRREDILSQSKWIVDINLNTVIDVLWHNIHQMEWSVIMEAVVAWGKNTGMI